MTASTPIHTEPQTAAPEDDFVVFLIGMRINTFWRLHHWLPVFAAMPRMLRELERTADSGLLGYRIRIGWRHTEVIQYWRSFEELHTYARAKDSEHLPAWADFNRRVANGGTVGIWHETYLVPAANHESIYRNMPVHGLAAATAAVPARGHHSTAAGRLNRTDGNDAPPERRNG